MKRHMTSILLTVIATLCGAATAFASYSAPSLTTTAWRLVEIQSMDDKVGTIRPAAASQFTMRLHGDGTVAMQLDCNRASARRLPSGK